MLRRSLLGALLAALLVFASLAGLAAADEAQQSFNLADFDNQLVLRNVRDSTSIAFTPDNKLLVITKGGLLYQHDLASSAQTLGTPLLDFGARVCPEQNETGLVGMALDPQFAATRWIYFYYTTNRTGQSGCTTASRVNRMARFTLQGSQAEIFASELVMLDNIPAPAGIHNGGDIQFGKDGHIYVSTGDGGCDYAGDSSPCPAANDAARDPHVLLGKVLRITRDGGIPADNPYTDPATSARCNLTGVIAAGKWCQETFVSGLRNPFRIVFDPNAPTTRFFINDVGQDNREEINLAVKGADYGWPCFEGTRLNLNSGKCNPTPPNLVPPIFEYQHDNPTAGNPFPCASVVGAAFVPNGLWPSTFDGTYIYGDYVCGRLFILKQNPNGSYSSTPFFTNLGRGTPIHVQFGPAGATQGLYYTSRGNNEIRRIVFTGSGNRTPTASFTATPTFGLPPLAVSFDASQTGDADGDVLAYSWSFGDGASATGVTTQHTYTTTGTYTATLTVSDGTATASFDARIDVGNAPPVPTIVPLSGTTYAVGEPLSLGATATDPDGDAVSFAWEVILHHNEHTHPYLSDVAGPTASFVAPAPEDLAATADSYLEVVLTATDSKGLAASTSLNLLPRKVNMNFTSDPPGVTLQVNDATIVTPATLVSWENYTLQVTAPTTATIGGALHTFAGWADGGEAQRAILTPPTGGTYRASYTLAPGENPPPDRYKLYLLWVRQR